MLLPHAACGSELRLEVEDDGVGFPERGTAAPPAGTGLIGIRERARTLGGHMTISSRRGACLSVRVPLPDGSR